MRKALDSKNKKRKWRHKRVRAKISGTADRPRLSVFRSNKHFYIQLINDVTGNTIVSASDREISLPAQKKHKKSKTADKSVSKVTSQRMQTAFLLGKLIAEKARTSGITQVVFDRGGYAYHGLVKAIAEGAREGGLQF